MKVIRTLSAALRRHTAADECWHRIDAEVAPLFEYWPAQMRGHRHPG
jgi:hypothetical protein